MVVEGNDDATNPPRVFILLENPKKNNNLGPILRCAAAFAVTQVVAVGFDKCSTEGSHGASKHVPIIAFPTVEQAEQYLRTTTEEGGCGCNLLLGLLAGVAEAFSSTGHVVKEERTAGLAAVILDEQHDEDTLLSGKSFPVNSKPFQRGGNTCIVMSKLQTGLPLHLAHVCDYFVHVPHSKVLCDTIDGGSKTTATLLDAQSCLSITLGHFTTWANYSEQLFEGHKFDVVKLTKGRVSDYVQASTSKDRTLAKEEQKAAAEEAITMFFQGTAFSDGSDVPGDY